MSLPNPLLNNQWPSRTVHLFFAGTARIMLMPCFKKLSVKKFNVYVPNRRPLSHNTLTHTRPNYTKSTHSYHTLFTQGKSPSPTVLDQPTDDHRWGVSGSATVGPGTSLLSSVKIRPTLRTSLEIWQTPQKFWTVQNFCGIATVGCLRTTSWTLPYPFPPFP